MNGAFFREKFYMQPQICSLQPLSNYTKFIFHSTLYSTQPFEPIRNLSPSPLPEMHFRNSLMASKSVFLEANESFHKCISSSQLRFLDIHFKKLSLASGNAFPETFVGFQKCISGSQQKRL